ncbi:MAG: bifunctional molybdenum cofactor biosynthesis protein MoaC/MoaB [Bacteroidota bacterium]|nr:bifunctional molybdenum cofactor biosynthesis protein MoaC/MoaB [Bacteroidota bacterium]
MIDISAKPTTLRSATATAVLTLRPETLRRMREGDLPKGDPLPVARVAAIQAMKRTSDIIPYCHPLPVEHASVAFDIGDDRIVVHTGVTAIYRTGVEMEAMTGAAVAVLTLYDMMKMVDESMAIEAVRLEGKRGGKSDQRDHYERPLRAAVLVMSDSIAAGTKSDASGVIIRNRLESLGVEVAVYDVIPDERAQIYETVRGYADDMRLDLVVTTGGTGFSPRDCTPEALEDLYDRQLPGVAEAMRAHGQARTPYSMLSRATAGIRGQTLILTLPGSRRGVREGLEAVFPGLLHSFRMLWMEGSPVHEAHPEVST